MVFMSFAELLQQSCRQRGGGADPQDQFPTCLPSAGMGHRLPLYSRMAASPGNHQAGILHFKEDMRLQFSSLAESAIISLTPRAPTLAQSTEQGHGRQMSLSLQESSFNGQQPPTWSIHSSRGTRFFHGSSVSHSVLLSQSWL